MATLPVEVVSVAHETKKCLKDAVFFLNAHQDAYKFAILELPEASSFRGASPYSFKSTELFQLLTDRKKALRGFHPHLVGFVDLRLDGSKWQNLFGTAQENDEGDLSGIGVVTFFQVSELFGIVPETIYAIYQLLSLAIRFTVGKGMIHQERRMCLFDFKRRVRSANRVRLGFRGGADEIGG